MNLARAVVCVKNDTQLSWRRLKSKDRHQEEIKGVRQRKKKNSGDQKRETYCIWLPLASPKNFFFFYLSEVVKLLNYYSQSLSSLCVCVLLLLYGKRLPDKEQRVSCLDWTQTRRKAACSRDFRVNTELTQMYINNMFCHCPSSFCYSSFFVHGLLSLVRSVPLFTLHKDCLLCHASCILSRYVWQKSQTLGHQE